MGTVVDIQVDGEKESEESDFGKAGVEFSMRTAVDGEKGTEESDFRKIVASDPVVYQLVRVEGDGRLVPATDDEVMEVEHLLEEDKSGLASDGDKKHFDGRVSNEGLPSKKSDFEGLSQSENTEVDSQELNARLEYIEVMLPKVKQEERLRMSPESANHSTKCMDVNHQTFDGRDETQACKDKLQPENTSMETAPSSMALNDRQGVQLESAETCSGPTNQAVTSSSTVSGTCTSSMPDFSILKGDICLDNLSIRELQEAFRATFGRQTSVKDKLWLKRRITMGLTNSCDVPTSNFVMKDNKIVLKEVKEEPIQVAKAYIEELSEFETRECSARLLSSVKNSGHDQSSPKSRIRPVRDIGSRGPSFSTRQDSLGGFGIQVPYVSRVRRGRPRKNFVTLMNYHPGGIGPNLVKTAPGIPALQQNSEGGSRVRKARTPPMLIPQPNFVDEGEKRDAETIYGDDEHDLGLEEFDASGDNTDGNANTEPASKCGVRRKHHRAWTLGEVLKLVEGVARYGAGRWSEIRRLAFASYSYRTSVDLKDKWRNLLRASLAQDPTDEGVGPLATLAKNSRKHASVPIPTPILSRVRELAEMNSQTCTELGPSKITGHGGRNVQEKGSGFL
ncbi:uncharacterized protein LOC120103862 [Phoenix dactylifera]|uniref:Uncharacterized protein LOC120103862 n=1 Tax=Phoenix dactylifera TaxID=42345 RepID=A0A8B9AIF6_PHODC|nr:uncharacterized protein LOC120103862 [Phoenix dactylifera]